MQLENMEHQKAALPLHKLIVIIVGLLGLGCVIGGVVAIIIGAQAPSVVEILGAKLTTGSVGVALVGIGLLVGLFTFRAVLKNQHDLAGTESHRD